MWYPARSVIGVPSVFCVGAVQDREAEPFAGLAGGAGGVGAGVGAGLGAGVGEGLGEGVGAGLGEGFGAGVGLAAGVGAALGGAGVVAVVAVAGDTPTPLPQADESSPAKTTADSENNVLRGLIAGMPRLKYGYMLRAICRSLGT
jgi:hypothetical protein